MSILSFVKTLSCVSVTHTFSSLQMILGSIPFSTPCVFLDSSSETGVTGKKTDMFNGASVSVLGWSPILTCVQKGQEAHVSAASGLEETWTDVIGGLDDVAQALGVVVQASDVANIGANLGWMGYFGYESGFGTWSFDGKSIPKRSFQWPDSWFSVFEWVAVQFHDTQEIKLYRWVSPRIVPTASMVDVEAGKNASFFRLLDTPTCSISKDLYLEHVRRIKHHIYEGDIYQANYSCRWSVSFDGQMLSLFEVLRAQSPTPFGAYIRCAWGEAISYSPELFLHIRNRHIKTSPIKGTRPKKIDAQEDAQEQQALIQSEKESAELMMIVDLERNDLGRVCETGSVKVSRLRYLHSFSHVHHMISDVEGTVKAEYAGVKVLPYLFPGGSITGAPKTTAMAILAGLEPYPRELYTGAIGMLGSDGSVVLNVAIRTLYSVGSTLYFHVGGGIVADSDPESEWEETLVKGRAVFNALEAFV